MDKELSEAVEKKKRDKWFDVWFAIEALAKERQVAKDSLENHVKNLGLLENVFVYEQKFQEAQEVENPIKGVDRAFSIVAEVKLLVRDIFTLMNTVMLYGPSAIEIMGPDKKEVRIDEVQNLANQLAGIVHQFASAGIGGILIAPDSKQNK